jgi:hypothetical protein
MTAIVPSDILFKLSAPNSNGGNIQAGYAGSSWGNFISTTLLNTSLPLDNLFTDISGPENVAGQVDYACLFIQNNTSSSNSMSNVIAWLPLSLASGTGSAFAMAADPTGITGVNNSTPQALTIGSPVQAPAGINTWVVPTNTTPTSPNYTNGLQLGTIAPTQCAAVWLRRTALNSASPTLSSFQVQLMFSTGS